MSTDPNAIRVIVADDHDLLRQGVTTSLDSFDDIEVVGQASTGEEAISLAAEQHPDVIVMDLMMPGIGGVEATRQLRGKCEARILALTSFVDNDLVQQALDAGASSYLLKNVDAVGLAEAVRMTARGVSTFAPEATRVLTEPKGGTLLAKLTEREQQVALLVADGRSNSDIAHELSLSIFTVKNHVSQILSKLDVQSRTQAASTVLRSTEADPS